MLEHDLEESVGYWLTITTHAYHRAINDELAPHGITFRQAQVLGFLALEGELSQTDLAAKMMIEAPTLVGILDRMEKTGWISRHRCQNDRRRKWIRANPSAKPVWTKIMRCGRRIRRQATEGLSDEQLATLRQCLEIVRENLTATTAAAN